MPPPLYHNAFGKIFGGCGHRDVPIHYSHISIHGVYSSAAIACPPSVCKFLRSTVPLHNCESNSQGPLNGGFQTGGGFPDLDLLFYPILSFLGLSRFFWDFPDLLGDGPEIFLICPFPLSRPI